MLDDHIYLETGLSRARIARKGAALTELQLAGTVLIAQFDPEKKVFGGSLLTPWPNRVRDGKYQFAGKHYQLEINDPKSNALHGFVFDQQAEILEQTSTSVTLLNQVFSRPDYPSALDIYTTYELFSDELKVSHRVKNVGSAPAPVGIGAHPYFLCDEDSTVMIGAETAAIHDSQMIPVGKLPASALGLGSGVFRKISELELDTQFENLDSVSATVRTSRGVFTLWQKHADYLMVYIAKAFPWSHQPGLAIALEPQTCEADAFNTGAGLRVLDPEDSTSMAWGLRLAS
jgi:aldose 1-epimerase